MLPLISIAVGLLLLASVLYYHTVWLQSVSPKPAPKPIARYPSVTVIHPVKDLDFGAAENMNAALETAYPGEVETIFVFDNIEEPALPLAKAAIAAHPDVAGKRSARILICGEPPVGRTGKLNAMGAGLEGARCQLIAFCDSDVRVAPDSLSHLVEALSAKPGAGAAFAPVAVTHPPLTLGDAGYALMLNGLYSPVVATIAMANGGEMPFIMGQFMVFKRETIESIGGLESADGQLVDDMYIGARVRAAGYRNVVAPNPVSIIQEGLSLKEFWGTYVRWITFSRSGLSAWGFRIHAAIPVAISWLGIVGLVVSLAFGWWLAAAVHAAVPLAVTWNYDTLHSAIGGARLGALNRWASLFVLVLAPIVAVSAYLHNEVVWRGNSYSLDSSGRLSGGDATPADQKR
jgi:ceramide glucosyltransferase